MEEETNGKVTAASAKKSVGLIGVVLSLLNLVVLALGEHTLKGCLSPCLNEAMILFYLAMATDSKKAYIALLSGSTLLLVGSLIAISYYGQSLPMAFKVISCIFAALLLAGNALFGFKRWTRIRAM